MFRRKEKQSLLEASRKALKDAERKVENRNILIADLQKKNEEQEELINRIKRIATSNTYNNEKAILGKIKELISDHQSQN